MSTAWSTTNAGVIDDLLDTEVDVRAEAPIQLDLPPAHQFALLGRAQIDEREPHRSLALVDQVALEHE